MALRFYIGCTDCPFTGRYKSQAMADSAYRKHSCDRWKRRASETERYLKRQTAIDRDPKPCLHKQADHQHGTYACYVQDGCRCLPCAVANASYEDNRVRQQAYGSWNGLVDAEPARRHIRSLMAQGMGLKRIVAVSNIAQGTLWKLLYGKPGRNGNAKPSARIRPATEARILAVELNLASGALIDSTGAVRRTQALVAFGWSQSRTAARLGILPGNFTALIHGRTAVTVKRHKAICALYDEWSMRPPPEDLWRDKIAASRSRHYAAAHGWLPPLAWDDELLDDPDAQPLTDLEPDTELDEAAVLRRLSGDRTVQLTRPEQAEVVRRMLAAGTADKDIERRTGINSRRALPTSERRAS